MKVLVSEKLKQFVERERYKYPFPLTQELGVETDLQITGDDTVEFILAFGKEFDVDVSHFPLGDYFNGEGLDIVGFITSIFRKKEKKILTLKDLDNAIIVKHL